MRWCAAAASVRGSTTPAPSSPQGAWSGSSSLHWVAALWPGKRRSHLSATGLRPGTDGVVVVEHWLVAEADMAGPGRVGPGCR